MKSFASKLSLLLPLLILAGCASTAPTTQPTGTATLSPEQQAIIATAQTLQAVGDTANAVIQAAVVADPALAADAGLAQGADADLDKVVAQIIADVQAGSLNEQTLISQITSDLATIIPIVGKTPGASAKLNASLTAKLHH